MGNPMLLHPHQQKIAKSNARYKVVRGGRRGGKTIVKRETMLFRAVSRTIRLARAFPDRSVIFIAPTQKQARVIVWESFKSRLGKVAQYNEARLEISLPTEEGGKSTIFVGGWENRENYRGMSNVIHIEFDEVDTMKDFFIGWEEIFRPMLIETGGSAGFGGTPKKENPNLRRLEKKAQDDPEWETFHFTSWDNPDIPRAELEKAKQEMDPDTYRQEIMAEYVDNAGALFRYDSLIDVFSNTIEKRGEQFLVVDVADDGSDKTVFSFWEDMEEWRRDEYRGLNTEAVIDKIRELTRQFKIPMSHVCVDAIGVGAGVASSSLLSGIIGFKSSYGAIKTDESIVLLPNVHYTKDAPLVSEYKNLRSQCTFMLADHVNNHKIASRVEGQFKEYIIEELSAYQDASQGDGKRMATKKEEVKDFIGRSPDHSDTWIMRMYFVIRGKLVPGLSVDAIEARQRQAWQMDRNEYRIKKSSTK